MSTRPLSDDDWAIHVYLHTRFDWCRCKAWIDSLPAGDLKDMMAERLAHGDADMSADNIDGAKRHYEYLLGAHQRQTVLLPLARAGQATMRGGKKGAEASRKTRRGAGSKRACILAALSAYRGSEPAKVATIARKTGATPRYVRDVLNNPEP